MLLGQQHFWLTCSFCLLASPRLSACLRETTQHKNGDSTLLQFHLAHDWKLCLGMPPYTVLRKSGIESSRGGFTFCVSICVSFPLHRLHAPRRSAKAARRAQTPKKPTMMIYLMIVRCLQVAMNYVHLIPKLYTLMVGLLHQRHKPQSLAKPFQ